MENLHAPWRIEYILKSKEHGCFFCDAASEKGDFRRHLLLFRDAEILVMMNRYPYNGGHLLAAPLRHSGDLAQLTESESQALMRALRMSTQALGRIMKPNGFNIGMNLGKVAGAGVEDHLHLHIVPRWFGDTNFMPVVAGTSTVPQALDELYGLLKPAFDELGSA